MSGAPNNPALSEKPWMQALVRSTNDPLQWALGGAVGFLREGEDALRLGNYAEACEAHEQVHAHLDWAREIIARRKRKTRRKS